MEIKEGSQDVRFMGTALFKSAFLGLIGAVCFVLITLGYSSKAVLNADLGASVHHPFLMAAVGVIIGCTYATTQTFRKLRF